MFCSNASFVTWQIWNQEKCLKHKKGHIEWVWWKLTYLKKMLLKCLLSLVLLPFLYFYFYSVSVYSCLGLLNYCSSHTSPCAHTSIKTHKHTKIQSLHLFCVSLLHTLLCRHTQTNAHTHARTPSQHPSVPVPSRLCVRVKSNLHLSA